MEEQGRRIMYFRAASVLMATLSILLVSFALVDEGAAMSFGKHRGGGATNGGDSGRAAASPGPSSRSLSSHDLSSIDAPAIQTPVPEPSTIMLLGGEPWRLDFGG